MVDSGVGRAAVGVGDGFCAGVDEGRGLGEDEWWLGDGVGVGGVAFTTIVPCAVPAAPEAVTDWVVPAGPAT